MRDCLAVAEGFRQYFCPKSLELPLCYVGEGLVLSRHTNMPSLYHLTFLPFREQISLKPDWILLPVSAPRNGHALIGPFFLWILQRLRVNIFLEGRRITYRASQRQLA